MRIACPQCGDSQEVRIWVDTKYDFTEDGRIEFAGLPEWSRKDTAWCNACGFESTAGDFVIEE